MDRKSSSSPWLFTLPSFLLCFLSLCTTHLCIGSDTDTISANRSISGNQTLVSSGGNFTLGFFTPGNSTYSYIGIWYNKVRVPTIVWVANRDNPITDRYSTELKISGGNLVMVNDSRVPAWSTNLSTSSGSSSTVAVLGDDGNFALKDGPNSSVTLWQSFDHPTHTWLPGAKLGIDKRTNTSQLLTSWKNAEDPSPGLFSLQLQPSSEYYIWWNRSQHYWTSGTWDNQSKVFSLVAEMRSRFVMDIYYFEYVDNDNESYFTYSVYPTFNTITRFVMDLSGQIKQESWLPSNQAWNLFWSQPRQQCEVHRLCGPFSVCSESTNNCCTCLPRFSISSPRDWNLRDWSSCCKRNLDLNCAATASNAEKDRFLPMSNMKLPDNSQSSDVGSDKECQAACLDNCSCTAYAFEDNACSIWIGDLFNAQQLTQGDTTAKSFYLRLAASDVEDPSKKRNITAIVAGSVSAAVAILAIVLFGVWRWRRRATVTTKTVEGSLIAFAYRDLQVATKNFSEKLGGGGFGSVFKGTLPDSSHIAVKKLESISQGEKQFRTEVSTIGTIQHVNLVRLRGFCSEGDKRLLVYDFMPNGSLEYHLFHAKDSKTLDWKTRYQIALGTARGLAYLHEKCRDCIIHCDIKLENILLDSEYCPKVADFGLAKLVGRDFSRVLTTMRGTRGYLAPEWISGVAITAKADVYSYGMMLFEFVSGRRNSEQSENGAIKFFPTWAASKITEGGDLLDLLDPNLETNADPEELLRICRVACWCVQDEETCRPSMGQVVQILEGVLDVNLPQIPRALQLFLDNQEHVVFFTESSSSNQSSQTKSHTSTASLQKQNSSSSTKSES
ncbi:G-type lectin S-receptor-like serine/threonine-protein kinase At2g19130 [Syzygium oleosum]|uniref:G-type lectin S-receptor-like serine/threonine-protein kinase At2g19130 n=1 Tax=Syzygium oleosum TaxID=219896 RepID=UPI0024BAFB21|nr:G-type lectin S-receptor-like serine/threonine-protein kinase At2g19130 [Syzygium oleosum]XP_056177584.1 G-type lectin S-receptor-like serine/threonine-protein kinase At2g19130 [Syzygium oleosum]